MSIAGNLSGMRSGIAAYFNKAKLEHWHANKRQGAYFCTSHSCLPYAKVAIFGETRKRKRGLDDGNG